jgi:hypothetical protein
MEIGGITIPDTRPVFLTALAIHVAAGLTGVVAGALAASARKRPGRHPRAGTVYLWGLGTVFVTATVMAALRWQHSWHLFVIATVAASLGTTGFVARRRLVRHWMVWHGAAMGMSYVMLLTGFYVDNGARLPLWNRLPSFTYWLLPSAIGIPLIVIALVRNLRPQR